MADTTKLKTIVEAFVRDELRKWYPGHTFVDKHLPLHKKRDGTFAYHKFDAVSEDTSIVANIKSSSWTTSAGKSPAGKVGGLFEDIYLLSLAEAKTKLLILTDKESYERFTKTSDGKLAEGVEIRLCVLPPKLQEWVRHIQQAASREMSGGKRS